MAGVTYRQMMANMIPKWLTDSQFIQAQTNAIAASNAYQASLAHAASQVLNTASTSTVTTSLPTFTTVMPSSTTVTIPNPLYYVGAQQTPLRFTSPPPPSWVRTRNRFAELLHAIEDINGLKFPYDDDINDMLDMRNFKRTDCKVRLTAFCCFMNCNGVDRHNHAKMVQAAEDMGVEFVP